jgi:hypothetical protein
MSIIRQARKPIWCDEFQHGKKSQPNGKKQPKPQEYPAQQLSRVPVFNLSVERNVSDRVFA